MGQSNAFLSAIRGNAWRRSRRGEISKAVDGEAITTTTTKERFFFGKRTLYIHLYVSHGMPNGGKLYDCTGGQSVHRIVKRAGRTDLLLSQLCVTRDSSFVNAFCFPRPK